MTKTIMIEKNFDNDLVSLGNSKNISMKTWKEISEELNNKYEKLRTKIVDATTTGAYHRHLQC